MSNNDTPAARLVDLLDLDPSDIAADIIMAADGHDARMGVVKSLLALAAAVASEVEDDQVAVAEGYDVDLDTGETHDGNGTEGEGRALALHHYACAKAAGRASRACFKAEQAFDEAQAKADAVPCEVTEAEFLAAFKAL